MLLIIQNDYIEHKLHCPCSILVKLICLTSKFFIYKLNVGSETNVRD